MRFVVCVCVCVRAPFCPGLRRASFVQFSNFSKQLQIEMTEAENEWVLRPYMNTAKKRKVLQA
jgi:hypothetical protein